MGFLGFGENKNAVVKTDAAQSPANRGDRFAHIKDSHDAVNAMEAIKTPQEALELFKHFVIQWSIRGGGMNLSDALDKQLANIDYALEDNFDPAPAATWRELKS